MSSMREQLRLRLEVLVIVVNRPTTHDNVATHLRVRKVPDMQWRSTVRAEASLKSAARVCCRVSEDLDVLSARVDCVLLEQVSQGTEYDLCSVPLA